MKSFKLTGVVEGHCFLVCVWLRYSATVEVREGGGETNGRTADTQECLGLKPCWETRVSRASVRNGRSRRYKIFTAVHSKEIVRYEAPSVRGLPGFKIGINCGAFPNGREVNPCQREVKKLRQKGKT